MRMRKVVGRESPEMKSRLVVPLLKLEDQHDPADDVRRHS
jgi:hypothetical protein